MLTIQILKSIKNVFHTTNESQNDFALAVLKLTHFESG